MLIGLGVFPSSRKYRVPYYSFNLGYNTLMAEGLGHIFDKLRSRFKLRSKPPAVEAPEANPDWADDYKLLDALNVEGYLHTDLTQQQFVDIKRLIHSPSSTVYDIGGGNNPCRAFALQDPDRAVSIDLAYNYYDGNSEPTDDRVFGGGGYEG